jgi:hypothetical protein
LASQFKKENNIKVSKVRGGECEMDEPFTSPLGICESQKRVFGKPNQLSGRMPNKGCPDVRGCNPFFPLKIAIWEKVDE